LGPWVPASAGTHGVSLCEDGRRGGLRASDDKTKLASMPEADIKPAAPGSPFWRFSLKLYRAPGVADACIALQEGAGVDVNLLLFLLWQATQRRAFTAADVVALEQRIGGWRDTAVIPLR